MRTTERSPLAIEKAGDRYTVSFGAHDVDQLAKALVREGRIVNGYTVEAAMIRLSEIGEPQWADELEFDSENEMFCVRCPRSVPLRHLVRRLERRLADPSALRRLIRSTRDE